MDRHVYVWPMAAFWGACLRVRNPKVCLIIPISDPSRCPEFKWILDSPLITRRYLPGHGLAPGNDMKRQSPGVVNPYIA